MALKNVFHLFFFIFLLLFTPLPIKIKCEFGQFIKFLNNMKLIKYFLEGRVNFFSYLLIKLVHKNVNK